MAELLGVLIRGLVVLVGHVVSALDLYELWQGRRRRRRLAALARGERVEIPCVLRDPALTGADITKAGCRWATRRWHGGLRTERSRSCSLRAR
jgi:hypothetical protein